MKGPVLTWEQLCRWNQIVGDKRFQVKSCACLCFLKMSCVVFECYIIYAFFISQRSTSIHTIPHPVGNKLLFRLYFLKMKQKDKRFYILLWVSVIWFVVCNNHLFQIPTLPSGYMCQLTPHFCFRGDVFDLLFSQSKFSYAVSQFHSNGQSTKINRQKEEDNENAWFASWFQVQSGSTCYFYSLDLLF